MEEQEVEVTEAEALQLLAHAADEPGGFAAHQKPAGKDVWLTATWQQNSLRMPPQGYLAKAKDPEAVLRGLMSGLLESERSHRQRATHQAAELQELQQQVDSLRVERAARDDLYMQRSGSGRRRFASREADAGDTGNTGQATPESRPHSQRVSSPTPSAQQTQTATQAPGTSEGGEKTEPPPEAGQASAVKVGAARTVAVRGRGRGRRGGIVRR